AVRPEQSETRRRIFVCTPSERRGKEASPMDERSCAQRIIASLARRAYRRPVTTGDVQALLSIYEKGRQQGGFETGIEWALERVLVAPDFLFRIERDPRDARPGVPFRLSDIDLASRLSFFLWSSIPDEELLEAAESGRLRDQAEVTRQVRRMLVDPRS